MNKTIMKQPQIEKIEITKELLQASLDVLRLSSQEEYEQFRLVLMRLIDEAVSVLNK